MQRGEYAHALDYLRLDPESEVSKAVSIDVLLRQQKLREALDALTAFLPKWGGYRVVQMYLQRRPVGEAAAAAHELQPANDPEINYFSAAHLAYAGQNAAALAMLQRTVEGLFPP